MKSKPLFEKGRVLVVAEVAQAHNGSLALAHSYIDAVAMAGADAVKFQTHIAQAESTPQEPWRVKFNTRDKTRFDYWKRMEFTKNEWRKLKRHAEKRGLLFLSSPFSIEAVDLLQSIGIRVWKIASGEITNKPMIDRILQTKCPIIISTGMSPLKEVDAVVGRIRRACIPAAVLQCTSLYPCPPEKVGLSMIPFYQKRYNIPAGLSDHTGKIYTGLAAAALGANILEVHVILDRRVFSPDASVSLTMGELRQLVEGIRFIKKMEAAPINKDALARSSKSMRAIFTKSVVARRDLPKGIVLKLAELAFKKPGTGLPASEYEKILGGCLKRAVCRDEMIKLKDIGFPEGKKES